MPKKSKSKITSSTKVMIPVDTSKPNGEHQFIPIEVVKKKLKMKDIFEMKK